MNGSGYYIATLSASTGERIRDFGLYERGNGSWSFDCGYLGFSRGGNSPVISIPFDRIRSVSLGGTWWGGRWFLGTRVALVEWTDVGGRALVSGFVFSAASGEQAAIVTELKVAVAGG